MFSIGACGGNQSDAEDDRRIEKLASYELLDTAPEGAKVSRPRYASKATSPNVMEMKGGPHGAGISWVVTSDVDYLAKFYIAALRNQGWQKIGAECGTLDKQRRQVIIHARRDERGYETGAAVELTEQTNGEVDVHVGVIAPFHDENSFPRQSDVFTDILCVADGELPNK